jgi:hypothetical protein
VSGETPPLEELAAELESIADKLRSEAIDGDEAAELVERCADLAQRIASEIDAGSRAAVEDAGQERLL